jgi:anti-sigma factor RsiW
MHPNEDALNELVDGSLDAATRDEVERHLAVCAACRQIADDLRAIRRTAAALDPREPPARVWSRIERAIKLEAEHAGAPGDAARASQASDRGASIAARLNASRYTITWLAAAAVLVLATAIGLRYGLAGRPAPQGAGDGAIEASAQAVEAELREAEAHYDKAIKGLEQIAQSEQSSLDPRTAATLQKNLAVIDQAISESRAAIRSQPASEPARESLMENFKTKLALLQDTVALINEMRKGNDAGAARIASGLKQKGN